MFFRRCAYTGIFLIAFVLLFWMGNKPAPAVPPAGDSGVAAAENNPAPLCREKAKVYFTKEISPEAMLKLYNLVNHELTGRLAIKVHTGEPDGPNIIPRDMVKAITDNVPGSVIVETNVYYPSPRQTTKGHREVLQANGWTFASVDILDEDGSIPLPVPNGKWFQEVAVGSHIANYDSLLVLTHFKGHAMGGFGGSLKNIAIGLASGAEGKRQMHSLGNDQWGVREERFMEHMAEGGKAVLTYFDGKIAFINVLRRMSVDCDCAGISAAEPKVPDIGMLASEDLLAIEQASIDLVYALPEEALADLRERIESRKGLHQLEAMQALEMGCREYELISLD